MPFLHCLTNSHQIWRKCYEFYIEHINDIGKRIETEIQQGDGRRLGIRKKNGCRSFTTLPIFTKFGGIVTTLVKNPSITSDNAYKPKSNMADAAILEFMYHSFTIGYISTKFGGNMVTLNNNIAMILENALLMASGMVAPDIWNLKKLMLNLYYLTNLHKRTGSRPSLAVSGVVQCSDADRIVLRVIFAENGF